MKLSRPEALALGLPERTAVAGIARRADGRAIAVVASAFHVRDRDLRARLSSSSASRRRARMPDLAASRSASNERRHARARACRRGAEKRSDERLACADKLATMGAFATGIAHEIMHAAGGDRHARRDALASDATKSMVRRNAWRAPRKPLPSKSKKFGASSKRFFVLRAARHGAARTDRCARFDRVGESDGRAPLRCSGRHARRRPRRRRAARRRRSPASDVCSSQALVNSFFSTLEGASKRGQRVTLSLRGENDHVCFLVRDDGVGIAADVAARATEPFFTTKPVVSRNGSSVLRSSTRSLSTI